MPTAAYLLALAAEVEERCHRVIDGQAVQSGGIGIVLFLVQGAPLRALGLRVVAGECVLDRPQAVVAREVHVQFQQRLS